LSRALAPWISMGRPGRPPGKAPPRRPAGYGPDQAKRASQRPDMQAGGGAPGAGDSSAPAARGTLGRLRRALGAGGTPAPAGRPPLRQRSRARTSIDDADTAGEDRRKRTQICPSFMVRNFVP